MGSESVETGAPLSPLSAARTAGAKLDVSIQAVKRLTASRLCSFIFILSLRDTVGMGKMYLLYMFDSVSYQIAKDKTFAEKCPAYLPKRDFVV